MYVLVVNNSFNSKAVDAAYQLAAYLQSAGIDFSISDSKGLNSKATKAELDAVPSIDLAVVLGGDGTILKTARALSGRTTPVLGINFGHLGFLANDSENGVIPLVASAFAGELKEERRANLSVDIHFDEDIEAEDEMLREHFRKEAGSVVVPDTDECEGLFALNEVALTRGAMGKSLDFSFDISDVPIAELSGDGMIVSSATGSTAYAMAAGGPLTAPTFDGMIVQPIAPHSLTARAVLTNPSDVVHVALNGEKTRRAATLFLDGDMVVLDKAVSDIYVRKGDVPTTLLYADADHFYSYAAKVFFKRDR